MKFDYTFRTHENELKSGSISASSRDEAFQRLKGQGIKPSKMVLSPGLVNYLASFGKRGWGLIVLSLALIALSALLLRDSKRDGQVVTEEVIYKDLKNRGLDQAEIDKYMKERMSFHESYRKQIADRVKNGSLTLQVANEMLKAVGIRPL